ncbi:MAG: DUF928 domain-containing protein [Tolypothrix sp. T3-bin4]|nr:DUF928 domain-containing protein [Tolypothrix sp. T3-bin4]
MNRSNSRLFLTLFPIILLLEVVISPSLATPIQPFEHPNSKPSLPPPRGDAPDDTVGGSSRDGAYCSQDSVREGQRGFSVLLPAYSEMNAERPTFSLYIPQTVAKQLFFSLKDSEENYYYQTIISLPEKAGEFRFQLPANVPTMEINKNYTWSLGLICQQAFDPTDPMLTGVIKRVGENPTTQNARF